MTSTRRAKYLMKKRKYKSPSSVTSQLSTCTTNDSGIDEVLEDLVCTNCVEADVHLSKICDELFGHPSIALDLLDGLANNPLFPKGDLDNSLSVVTGVPITTSICLDCSYSDCDEPKKTKYIHDLHDVSCASAGTKTLISSLTSSLNKTHKTHSYTHFHHSQSRQTSSKISTNSNGNYEKERREIERQLIRKIYDLVCVDQTLSTSSPVDNCDANSSSSSTSFITDQISKHATPNTNANRITKLFVSELAIKRMENIPKLDYPHQFDRLKRKLLDSYMAFAKLNEFVVKSDMINNNNGHIEILNIVPYIAKIKELKRSLQTKY